MDTSNCGQSSQLGNRVKIVCYKWNFKICEVKIIRRDTIFSEKRKTIATTIFSHDKICIHTVFQKPVKIDICISLSQQAAVCHFALPIVFFFYSLWQFPLEFHNSSSFKFCNILQFGLESNVLMQIFKFKFLKNKSIKQHSMYWPVKCWSWNLWSLTPP